MKTFIAIAALLTTLAIGGCSTVPPRPIAGESVLHTLTANIKWDSPGVVLLDFKYLLKGKQIGGYSRSGVPGNDDATVTGLYGIQEGRNTVGDSAYFKWRESKTGSVFTETVTLVSPTSAQSGNLRGFYFVLRDGVAHTYFVSTEKAGSASCGLRRKAGNENPTPDNKAASYYCDNLLWKIHPEQRQLNFPVDNETH